MTDNTFNITDEQRDYSSLGLQENPFPYSPVPDDNPKIYCGQQQATNQISKTVSAVLATGKSKHLVITGRYGNGKSHTLKYTRSLIRDRDDVLVGYVAQPGDGIRDIYHEFMYDLGFNRIQELAYEWLAMEIDQETSKNPVSSSEMRTLLNEGDVLLSEIVPNAVQRLSEVTKFADFARAIVHMVYEDTNLYAWQWLTAEGIRYEQRKEMEIHSGLDDDTTAVRSFTALKSLLIALGYRAVFIFLDEFESIARLSPKDKQTTLNSIRHLMDQNSHGISLLFGCAPEVWQDVMSEYHAFSERIGQEVSLQPLTDEHMTTLVSNYLDLARPESKDGIAPFRPDALESVHRRAQGNVRQILTLCGRALDGAVDREQESVDVAVVESLFTN